MKVTIDLNEIDGQDDLNIYPAIFLSKEQWDNHEYSVAFHEKNPDSLSEIAYGEPDRYPCLVFGAGTEYRNSGVDSILVVYIYDFTLTFKDDEEEALHLGINVSDMSDVHYLRSRNRHTPELEAELISLLKQGKRPNMMDFGVTAKTSQALLDQALKPTT